MQILQWRKLIPKVCWVFNMAASLCRYSYAFPQFPKFDCSTCGTGFAQITIPPPPPLQTKGIFVSISVLNDLLSGNPQNRCQGVIPFSCVYKDSLIFRQLNELFFQFYKVSSSILRPISMKSEHTQRKSIRKRPNKQLKNFWSCLNVEFVFKILPRPLTNEM